jgi:hypothetical protein
VVNIATSASVSVAPHKVALLAEHRVPVFERGEDVPARLLVSLLRRGKSRAVHAVVDRRVDGIERLLSMAGKSSGGARDVFLVACASNCVSRVRITSRDSLLTMVFVCLSHRMGTVTRPL